MENLISGNWWEYKIPFRYFRAFQVLNPTEYQDIASNFSRILQEICTNSKQQYKVKNYDAVIIGMNSRLSKHFKPFFEASWIEKLSQIMGIPFVPRIDGAIHSHPVNSKTGWIHSDYCLAWFDESAKQFENNLLYPDNSRCEYFTGKMKTNDAHPKAYIRAASLIFFLCNDGWKKGEGGETGLYGAAHSSPHRQVELIPPINNSLLFFECSPHSYHSFITNRIRIRNSIILFLHSTVEYAQSRWSSYIHLP